MSIKTVEGVRFHESGLGGSGQHLFGVTPNIGLVDALNSASDLLSTVRDSIFDAGMGTPLKGDHAWMVLHSINSAKAVIDSLWEAAEDAEREANQKEDAK